MSLNGAPVLPLAAALALGIAVAPWVSAPPLALIGLAAALLALGAAALVVRLDRLAALALLASLAVIGAARESASIVPADDIARRALPVPVTIEGRLAGE